MLKNAFEDHVEKCIREKGTCKTCALDMSVLDTWNDIHRGSTILSDNHGKSIQTIIEENGWQTDRDNGNFFPFLGKRKSKKNRFKAVKCNGKKKYEYIFSLLYMFSQCKLFQNLMLLNAIHSTNHSFIQSFIHPIIQSFNLLFDRVFLHYMQLPPFLPHPHPTSLPH